MELESGRKTSDGGGSILPTDLPDDPETPRRTSPSCVVLLVKNSIIETKILDASMVGAPS